MCLLTKCMIKLKTKCTACEICPAFKPGVKKGPTLRPRPIPPYAFHTLQPDYLGPLSKPSYTGKKHILVITCKLSKFMILEPVDNPDTIQTEEKLYQDVFPMFGVPRLVHNNKGAGFVAKLTGKLLKLIHVEQTYVLLNHHRSMGQVERSVRTIRELMDPLIEEYGNDWE